MRAPRSRTRSDATADEWTPELVPELARRAGLAPIGEAHWKVIASCREEAARTGRSPGLRRLVVLTGLDTGELHRLFPGDVETLVARLAGHARSRTRARGRTGGGSVEE